MAISSKMRRVGESVYYKEILKRQLNEIVGEDSHKLEHIVGRRKLIIHTDRVSDELLAEVKATAEATISDSVVIVQYNHNMEISWRDINKYAACRYGADIIAVNPNYKKDVTNDGEWVYPLPEMINPDDGSQVTSNGRWGVFCWNGTIKKVEMSLPKANTVANLFRGSWSLKRAKINSPVANRTDYMLSECDMLEYAEVYAPLSTNDAWNGRVFGASTPKLERAKLYFPKARVFNLKANNLRELELELPSLTSQENNSVIAQLNKDSANVLLNSLPASQTTGRFTIGIHVDHQNDEEVLAAISNAEAKGWMLIVQWNGTPTSTASTMAMGSLIYAKMGELERPDGTIEQFLDWGHYVTNPEGYESFRSLESAYEYFGLEFPNIN